MSLLSVSDLHAGYGKRVVLEGLELKIDEGERVLLMGPNGSGKSTLLKCIVGTLRPYRGKIYFNGMNITNFGVDKRIKLGIGYLKQYRNIFPDLTVLENLELSYIGTGDSSFNDGLDWVLSIFPLLKPHLQTRAGLLSGGERQALAVSMVLIKNMKMLLLDEPTAGLAPKAAKDVLEGIRKAQEERKLTILIVEHNLKLIAPWVKRIVGMVEGRIALDTMDIKTFLEDKTHLEWLYFGGTYERT